MRLIGSLLIVALAASTAHSEKLMTLPAPPEVIRGGQVDFFRNTPASEQNNTVNVFYATKRLPSDNGEYYSKHFDDNLRVGQAQLMIGREGLSWSVLHMESIRNATTRAELTVSLSDVEQYATLAATDSLATLSPGMRDYLAQIDQTLAKTPFKDITIIVHGAFNSFYYAVAEAAQYRFYTGKNAVVIAYSWPSTQSVLTYETNVKHAQQSETDLVRLLKILAQHSSAERINVLGYSVGGRLVGGAMVQLADDYTTQELTQLNQQLRLGELYMTSSDQPLEQWRNYLPQFTQMFDRVTVTGSETDPVLGRAEMTGGGKRAGRPPKPADKKHQPTPAQDRHIRTAIETDKLHLLDLQNSDITGYEFVHGAWYLNPWVSSDVIVTLNLGLHPRQRGLVVKDDSHYQRWIFPENYVDTLRTALKPYRKTIEALQP